MGTCTILNMTGDVTIHWDNKKNQDVKNWIEDKLKEGCTFFIVEKRLGFIPVKTQVSNVNDLPNKGSLTFDESDPILDFKNKNKKKENHLKFGDFGVEELIIKGSVVHFPKEDKVSNKVKKVAKTVEEIFNNDTMCTKRIMGG